MMWNVGDSRITGTQTHSLTTYVIAFVRMLINKTLEAILANK
jgi:hypothetical protein